MRTNIEQIVARRIIHNFRDSMDLDELGNEVESFVHIDHLSRQLIAAVQAKMLSTEARIESNTTEKVVENDFVPASGIDYFKLWLNHTFGRKFKVEFRPLLISTIVTTNVHHEYYCPHLKCSDKHYNFLTIPIQSTVEEK